MPRLWKPAKAMSNRRNSGFTLIEVMIALAIVGGLMGTLLYTIQYHVKVATDARDFAQANDIAHNMLEEMKDAGITKPDVKNGDVGQDYHYHFEVVQDTIFNHDVFKLKMVVTGRGQEARLYELLPSP